MSFFAFRACLILSFASLLLCFAVLYPIDAYLESFRISFAESRLTLQAALFMSYLAGVLAVLVILIGIMPTLIHRWYTSLFGTIAATGFFVLTVAAEVKFNSQIGLAICSTLVGIALDLIFIFCLTKLLEHLQKTDKAWAILLGASASLLVAVVLAIPFIVGTHSILRDYEDPSIEHGDFIGAVTPDLCTVFGRV
jgi:hypothetical protein